MSAARTSPPAVRRQDDIQGEIQNAERLARIEEQLKALPEMKELLEKTIEELRAKDNELLSRINTRDYHCVGQTGLVSQHSTKLEEHTKDIKKLKDDIEELKRASAKIDQIASALKWVAAAAIAMVLGLLWAIFTHQVELVFH